ncbi:MAG: hypothetical protein IJO71_00560 [Microbacterium sp.]|jgi:hypothetical protein|uniref:hypothetical protein n=1 Tax=Microbacterium sp. TaxID=51671 RepID=UPI0025CC6CEF|nr:hypothetical protein [Microbacterium sp.]MBQ9915677.1 hypothetical protein [Microbacterium sp.]
MWQKIGERWTWLFWEPWGALLLAGVVVTAVAIVARRRRRVAGVDVFRLPLALRVVAGLVVAGWLLDSAVPAFGVLAGVTRWWQFALPLVVAAAGVGVALVGVGRVRQRAGVPALVGVRRTWTTFPSRAALVTVAVGGVLLVAMTLICGVVSVPDESGAFVLVDFGDAGVSSFYGWAFGVPVLVALVALALAAVAVLRRIAAPAFGAPETVARERRERGVVADAVLALAGGAIMLSLGSVLYFVGSVGMSSGGVGIPGVGDFVWTPGYSAIAPALRWTGWALLSAGSAVLLVLALGRVPFAWPARTGTSGSLGLSGSR